MKKQKIYCNATSCMYQHANNQCTLKYNVIDNGVCEDFKFSESIRTSSKRSDVNLYVKTVNKQLFKDLRKIRNME